jgi:uncharacterized protein (DUF1778 family)
MEATAVVERIRLLLARFSENEEAVRRLVATDPRFDALCHEYRKIIELLDCFEAEVERLRKVVEAIDRPEAEVKRLTRLRAGRRTADTHRRTSATVTQIPAKQRCDLPPSSRSRCIKAAVRWLSAGGEFAPKYPMVGSLPGCWPRAPTQFWQRRTNVWR